MAELPIRDRNSVSSLEQKYNLKTIKAERIQLEGYTTINNGFSVDLNGNMTANNGTFNGDIYLPNGGQIVGSNGLLSNLQYSSGPLTDFGFFFNPFSLEGYQPTELSFCFNIPSDFTITSAKITLQQIYLYWYDYVADEYFFGFVKNIKAYKKSVNNIYKTGGFESETDPNPISTTTEITGAFGTSGYTAPTPTLSSYNMQIATSSDIKSSITTGNNLIILKSSYTPVLVDGTHEERPATQNSGYCTAYLDITGYYNYN